MKTKDELLQTYADECFKVFETKDMVDYCTKKVSGIIEFPGGGLYVFDKPKIKTHFCFGEDGGESYNEACNMAYNVALKEEYFLHANLRDIDEKIANLKGDYTESGRHCRIKFLYYDKSGLIYDYAVEPWWRCEHIKKPEPLTDEDTAALIALFEEERAKFEKRLKTYWKRYGASKLKTWTYWVNA